jgi:hypothetical protein
LSVPDVFETNDSQAFDAVKGSNFDEGAIQCVSEPISNESIPFHMFLSSELHDTQKYENESFWSQKVNSSIQKRTNSLKKSGGNSKKCGMFRPKLLMLNKSEQITISTLVCKSENILLEQKSSRIFHF